jgi:hypothetical protein
MLFRNIEDFEDDLIGENNKINLKGIDESKFNIIIDQTNQSGILTGVDSKGELTFPTCDTIKLPKGSTAEIQDRTGIKISCDEVKGMPYNKISCMDGNNLTECCGKEVCSKEGGCYQIQYNQKTKEFKCVGGTPSKLSLFGCDSNKGCIAATNMANAMSQDTCVNLCKNYKKCDNKNLVTIYSTTNSNEYYDFDTQFPNNPCNLKDNTVEIRSSPQCHPIGKNPCGERYYNVIKPKVCDLVKRNANGCNDVDNGLNPTGSQQPLKDGDSCDINSIYNIPFGVNVTAYGNPCTNFDPLCWLGVGPCAGNGMNHCCSGSFANEQDMCPMEGNCGSVGNPQNFDHDNTGDLKETSCSMSFRLGPQNQHACD